MKFNPPKATALTPAAQRGMALVITLIMLSVTLVMAIAFLAVSNRERVSVTTSTDQANARLATESALAAAQSQILANVLSSGGGAYNFGLIVSTNYINAYGFVANSTSPTNVNFDYRAGAPSLQPGDFEQDVANLLYLPRVPVLVSSNEPNGRFYLDLNRNGVFDDTSSSPTNISPTMFYVDAFGNTNSSLANVQTGDPQWIGALERPDVVHSPDNKFVYRYAFMAVPIGNGLDLNYIHNAAKNETVQASPGGFAPDGYFRNQGVGSWEINLAAFLADLNTNEWYSNSVPDNFYYFYHWPVDGSANQGVAFNDAQSLLSWRYGFNYNSLFHANSLFGNSPIFANTTFPADNIDEYSDGPLQTTTTNINESFSGTDNPGTPWAGADNTNRFFNLPSELFDPTKSSPAFVNRLTAAGTKLANGAHPTYDRYTYYQMLQELGTDSDPDDTAKLDLNYDNTDGSGHVVRNAQTNLVPWTALAFFTNAADRMLRTYTTNWFQSNPSNYLATYYGIIYTNYIDPGTGLGFTNNNSTNGCPLGVNFMPTFSITNIPVMVNGQWVYSPAVNRVLQLTANIYDASTNSPYPSVFHPEIYRDLSGNVFIIGYQQILSTNNVIPSGSPIPVLTTPVFATDLLLGAVSFANVYDVPWIIGAKKNLPNFNQFYMLNTVQLTRKLQVTRKSVEAWSRLTAQDFTTNQLFVMSITNQIGYSLWNSYSNSYVDVSGQPPTVVVNNLTDMVLSNSAYIVPPSFTAYIPSLASSWPGAAWNVNLPPGLRQAATNSFVCSGNTFIFMPQSAYQYFSLNFLPESNNSTPTFDPTVLNTPLFPQFYLITSNRFQAYIVDNGNVIDYVQFGGPHSIRNLNNEIYDGQFNSPTQMWVTNASGNAHNGANQGVIDQILFSQTAPPAGSSTFGWKAPPNMPPGLTATPQTEADYFKAFFTAPFIDNGQTFNNTNTTSQAPYTPTRTMYDLTLWQPNDPLVHYIVSDLTETNSLTGIHHTDDPTLNPPATVVQNALGMSGNFIGDDRYQPWGRNSQFASLNNVDTNAYNPAYRDPLMYSSDNWGFPTNRYPTVGWLGRVHRGTPWQTVYLKATNILLYVNPATPTIPGGQITWMDWSGNINTFDAFNAAPVQDDVLFDIFTTALDDNSSRGSLSVNQPYLAAWSAILSGLDVVSNATSAPFFNTEPLQANFVLNPAGADTNSAVWQMVLGANGIIQSRAIYANGVYARPGDIVRAPALSDKSPLLNLGDSTHRQYDVSDEMYEQIPQKILGLVRIGSPRYVIYCYGQALRPAQDGTALDLAHNGLVTNYQVVAESAARAVVSVHPKVSIGISSTTGNYIPVTNYTTTVESYNLLPPD